MWLTRQKGVEELRKLTYGLLLAEGEPSHLLFLTSTTPGSSATTATERRLVPVSESKDAAPTAEASSAKSREPQIIGSMEKVCPYDQTELADSFPGWFTKFLGTLYRRCPSCRREYRSSPATDLLASRGLSLLSLVGSVPTLPRIESAQRETSQLGEQVEMLQKQLESIQAELPTPSRDISTVKESLNGVEGRLEELGRELEEARREFLELVPDAGSIAYLKLARAEMAEVRGLVARHIEDHERRQSAEAARNANRLAKLAIGISVVGVSGTVAGLLLRSQ